MNLVHAASRGTGTFRTILLASCWGYFIQKAVRPKLLPHGEAVPREERIGYKSIDPTNDSLQGKHGKLTKIYERLEPGAEPLLKGPETVVINPKDGSIHVLTEEAKLVLLSDFESHTKTEDDNDRHREATIVTAKTTAVVDLGMGRPLGGRFTADGKTIYIADALLGLVRVQNPGGAKSKVELVAHHVMDQDGNPSPILYANDVTIGPKTGKVYFTDASDIPPDRIKTRTWDTMYAAKTDMIRGKRSGRLLEYDPKTEEVRILAKDFWFANGVGVDKDESFIFLAETFAMRLVKYHLKNGTVETLVDSPDMTGYPDGADCAPVGSANPKCYAVMPSAVVPLAKFINMVPASFDRFLRNLVLMLPKKMAPPIKQYGGAVEVDPTTKEIRYFQDPYATDIGHLAGVTVWNQKLYLGSLRNNFVGVYDLN